MFFVSVLLFIHLLISVNVYRTDTSTSVSFWLMYSIVDCKYEDLNLLVETFHIKQIHFVKMVTVNYIMFS